MNDTTGLAELYRFCNWQNKRKTSEAPRKYERVFAPNHFTMALRELSRMPERNKGVERELILVTRGDGEEWLYLVEHKTQTKKSEKGER